MSEGVELAAKRWLAEAKLGDELSIGWKAGHPVTYQTKYSMSYSQTAIESIFTHFRQTHFYGKITLVMEDSDQIHTHILQSRDNKEFE